MAIAHRAMGTVAGSTTTSVAIPRPTGTAVNDILVACVHVAGGSRTITAPAGWNVLDEHSPGSPDMTHYTYWRRYDGGANDGATYTFSWTGSQWCEGMIGGYSGCETSGSPLDAAHSEADGTGATVTATAVTTVTANTMLVIPAGNWNGGSWSNSSSLNERYDGTGSNNCAWFDVAQAAVGSSGTKTMTAAAGISDWIVHIIPLREPQATKSIPPGLIMQRWTHRTRRIYR